MNTEREIIDQIEEARQHQDFRLEKALLLFAGKVCARMENLDINKAELARRLNTSRAFVTKVLKCNHNITLKTMDSVAYALGMELSLELNEIKSVRGEVAVSKDKVAENNFFVYLQKHVNEPVGISTPTIIPFDASKWFSNKRHIKEQTNLVGHEPAMEGECESGDREENRFARAI